MWAVPSTAWREIPTPSAVGQEGSDPALPAPRVPVTGLLIVGLCDLFSGSWPRSTDPPIPLFTKAAVHEHAPAQDQ